MELKITPISHDAEEEGVWTEYMGVQLKIARANNDIYKREFRRLSKPYQRQITKNSIDPDTAKTILAKAAAKGLLKGWKNFAIDGKEVPFTVENATQLFINDEDCLDFVTNFAQDLDNFIEEDEDEIAKE